MTGLCFGASIQLQLHVSTWNPATKRCLALLGTSIYNYLQNARAISYINTSRYIYIYIHIYISIVYTGMLWVTNSQQLERTFWIEQTSRNWWKNKTSQVGCLELALVASSAPSCWPIKMLAGWFVNLGLNHFRWKRYLKVSEISFKQLARVTSF